MASEPVVVENRIRRAGAGHHAACGQCGDHRHLHHPARRGTLLCPRLLPAADPRAPDHPRLHAARPRAQPPRHPAGRDGHPGRDRHRRRHGRARAPSRRADGEDARRGAADHRAASRSLQRRWRRTPVATCPRPAEQLQEMAEGSGQPSAPQKVVLAQPGIISWAADTLSGIGGTLGATLLFVVFLLSSGDLFLQKLVRILPTLSDKKRSLRVVHDVESEVSRYLFTITLINIGFGTAVGLSMAALGMPNPVLWGVGAALLNYIPYLGALVGMALAGAIGLITFPTLTLAALPPLAYFICNAIEGSVVTPLTLGRRLELNPVAILIALAFGGWMWGDRRRADRRAAPRRRQGLLRPLREPRQVRRVPVRRADGRRRARCGEWRRRRRQPRRHRIARSGQRRALTTWQARTGDPRRKGAPRNRPVGRRRSESRPPADLVRSGRPSPLPRDPHLAPHRHPVAQSHHRRVERGRSGPADAQDADRERALRARRRRHQCRPRHPGAGRRHRGLLPRRRGERHASRRASGAGRPAPAHRPDRRQHPHRPHGLRALDRPRIPLHPERPAYRAGGNRGLPRRGRRGPLRLPGCERQRPGRLRPRHPRAGRRHRRGEGRVPLSSTAPAQASPRRSAERRFVW